MLSPSILAVECVKTASAWQNIQAMFASMSDEEKTRLMQHMGAGAVVGSGIGAGGGAALGGGSGALKGGLGGALLGAGAGAGYGLYTQPSQVPPVVRSVSSAPVPSGMFSQPSRMADPTGALGGAVLGAGAGGYGAVALAQALAARAGIKIPPNLALPIGAGAGALAGGYGGYRFREGQQPAD